MEKLIGSTPAGMGLATTAILVVLLERLISTGALTRAEVADIFGSRCRRDRGQSRGPAKAGSSTSGAVPLTLAARSAE